LPLIVFCLTVFPVEVASSRMPSPGELRDVFTSITLFFAFSRSMLLPLLDSELSETVLLVVKLGRCRRRRCRRRWS
jgi:hypothetical protein